MTSPVTSALVTSLLAITRTPHAARRARDPSAGLRRHMLVPSPPPQELIQSVVSQLRLRVSRRGGRPVSTKLRLGLCDARS